MSTKREPYVVVEAGTPDRLAALVNEWIVKGWKPQGGPFVMSPYGRVYQALFNHAEAERARFHAQEIVQS